MARPLPPSPPILVKKDKMHLNNKVKYVFFNNWWKTIILRTKYDGK